MEKSAHRKRNKADMLHVAINIQHVYREKLTEAYNDNPTNSNTRI